MPERPLLLFPSRSKNSYESKARMTEKGFKTPGRIHQIGRVEKIFQRLNGAFTKKRGVVSTIGDGLVAEMVLVFETRGNIQDFFKAVAKIPELKWLGEKEEEFDSSDEFHFEERGKKIPGKLYFMLADQAAMKELQSLWNTWKSSRQKFKTGYTKWKNLFNLLVDIREWGVKDRIEETGIIADWENRRKMEDLLISFEIELWFRKSVQQRQSNKNRIDILINKYGGKILSECVIEEISYHGLLAESPISIFSELSEDSEILLFKSSDIMFLKPVGQSVVRTGDYEKSLLTDTANREVSDFLPPVIALLDGVPAQNHIHLASRLNIHDPDQFERNYPVDGRNHATAMASIILHGDLNSNNTPLKTKLLVRPVMKFYPFGEGGSESVPDNILLVDLIHRAVRQLKEKEGLSTPVSPNIKVINLSMGDYFRVFNGLMSPWAKLIDWMSFKYNILFIVSAGNIDENLIYEIENESFNDLLNNSIDLEKHSLRLFYNKNRFRKIISPAESINSLTVGSAHSDSDAVFPMRNLTELYSHSSLSSPISRMGMGFRKSIKPDLLAKGGRILLRNNGNNTLAFTKYNSVAPGIKVACPGDGGNKVAFTKGTSNSAALVSHTAGKLYESFLDTQALREHLSNEYFAVTAKALLIHSTCWSDDAIAKITNAIPDSPNDKDLVSRFLGYGLLNPEKIFECTSKRVTLIGCHTLTPDTAYIYDLPLSDKLSSTTKWRKITITLAWMTPINTSNQRYRTHKLWFDFPNNDLEKKFKAKRTHYDNDTVRRGTVQHEIFFSDKAQPFSENSTLKIKVNCKIDAKYYNQISFTEMKNRTPIRYALIVTLEIDPEIDLDIYEQVEAQIRQQVKI